MPLNLPEILSDPECVFFVSLSDCKLQAESQGIDTSRWSDEELSEILNKYINNYFEALNILGDAVGDLNSVEFEEDE